MRKLRFVLFGNIYQPKKSVWVQKLLCSLQEHGADIIIDQTFHDYLTRKLQLSLPKVTTVSGNHFDADFAVSMGGDGTFLQTACRVGEKQIPIIGVNMGRMGFLADLSGDEIDQAIQQIYDHQYRIEERSLLQVDYEVAGQPQPPHDDNHALNEVAVLKRDSSSMISIRVSVNNEYLTTYQADGLIVNTPTGSTGYALSVGGPIMSPEAHILGITPVAPHTLNVRPIAVCDDAEVTLTVESRNHNFLVAVDGRSHTCTEDTRLRIRKAPFHTRILRHHDNSFFHTLRNKLAWGTDVRND